VLQCHIQPRWYDFVVQTPPPANNLPDFLVVGAQKSGTTWLDAVLRTHPDVYMPSLRKEVHFFDANFDKGTDWYARYFVDATTGSRIGEATPMYLYDPQVPKRIFATIPDARIIVILRNPPDRAVSQYRHVQARRGFTGSFTEFMIEDDTVIDRGMYAEQLQRYLDLWPPESVLTLIFEHATHDPDALRSQLASFLDIDGEAFGDTPVNSAQNRRPVMKRTRRLAASVTSRMQSPAFDRLFGTARSMGVERVFGTQDFTDATTGEWAMLTELYMSEILRTEDTLGIDLDIWRTP